jgi:lipoate-protein ligase A
VSYDGEDRKISGSAFRETKKRAFHHGTLLINADLDRLKNYLIPSEKKLEIKGVHSIRSNVINLNEHYLKNLKNTQTLENTESPSALSPEAVTEAIMASFLTHYAEDQGLEASKPEHLNLDSLASIPSLKSCHEHYQSWDWRFGRTLPFTHRLEKEFSFGSLSLCLTIENALIQNCEGDGNINLDPLKKALMQVKYDADAIQQALKNLTHYPEDFKQWLISEI